MIRKATVEDLDALEAIEAACFPDLKFSMAQLRWFLTRHDSFSYVDVQQNKVIGSGIASVNGATGTIDTVAVLPEHRRRRLGRALMDAMESECARRGVRLVRLEVAVDNDAAIRLYQAMGYSEDRLVSDHYGPGRDAVVMTKRLRARHAGLEAG